MSNLWKRKSLDSLLTEPSDEGHALKKTLGAKAVLAVSIDPTQTATRLNVSGAASVATGAQVNVTLTGLSRGTKSFQVIQAGSLSDQAGPGAQLWPLPDHDGQPLGAHFDQ